MQSRRARVVIEAGYTSRGYIGEVWALRHLIWTFAWREIVLRHKQTLAGLLWVVMRPLVTTGIFALIFGKFLKVPSGELPYALLILSGLTLWQFGASSFAGASESLFAQAGILSKVYFPRIIAPISAFVVNAIDLVVTLALLAVLMLFYGVIPDARVVVAPLFILVLLPACAGLGLWFAAVSAKYRDFRNIVPFLVLLSLYISPVAFSSTVVPQNWQFWYWLNPFVGAIEGFRWALFEGKAPIHWAGLYCSMAISLLLLLTGYAYFRRVERSIVDVI